MDKTKEKIISIFKEKGPEISTKELANSIYEDYIFEPKNTTEKRNSAKLHRKLLHHINLLIRDGILRVVKHGEKGHKYFSLNIEDGEEITAITPKYKKRIAIEKPAIPVMPIEGYEQLEIVIKYEPGTWINRINAIVLKCKKIESLDSLKKILEDSFSVVNDAICLENFEEIISKSDKKEIIEFVEKLGKDSEDYGKKINFIINFENLNGSVFLPLLKKSFDSNLKNILFIYNVDSEIIQEHLKLFSEIIGVYISNKIEVKIKNKRMRKSPVFFGRAGPYCFLEKEWEHENDCIAVACSQCSLTVDVEKFYNMYGLDVNKFSELMINISKSFLSANSIQRRKSFEYFKKMVSLNKPNERDFLEFSRNYIRFWNYGIGRPEIDSELILNMISEAKKKIDELAFGEEIIYLSCGMPTRFKIALSCAFSEAEEKLSEAKYKKFILKGLNDLYTKKSKKEIKNREVISEIFDGGNETTFHRFGELSSEEVIREISFILNTFKFPLFSYSFENIKGNMQLTQYLK